MDCSMPGLPVHHQLLEFTQFIESVMPSNHLILCHSLLLLPSIFPSIRVFSNESILHIRWPKSLVQNIVLHNVDESYLISWITKQNKRADSPPPSKRELFLSNGLGTGTLGFVGFSFVCLFFVLPLFGLELQQHLWMGFKPDGPQVGITLLALLVLSPSSSDWT